MYRFSFYVIICILACVIAAEIVTRDAPEQIPALHHEEGRKIFQLYDPEMAEGENKDLVMLGYRIIQDTKKMLPDNVGNKLSCINCHFAAGNSYGGERNGLCLVGVVHLYPKTQEDGSLFSLSERINGCMMRSMNGKELRLDSHEMHGLLAYLEWISTDIPKQKSYPWLGIKPLRTDHVPNPENGKKIYELKCALCHGMDGRGQDRRDDLSYPPLWNENSFNDGAGMNKLPVISYFIYKNMPFEDPCLSIEEALDVGSYVIKQPRPHLKH